MKHLFLILLFLLILHPVQAQFNPNNPSEPNMSYKYRIEVSSNYPDQTYCSGTGKYTEGSLVYINTSSRYPDYRFSHWTLNGVEYTTEQNFKFTVGTEHVQFKAHYRYDPVDPNEPNTQLMNRLYLQSNPEDMASFSCTSGDKHLVGSYIQVSAYANQGYVFLGWYEGPKLVSSTSSFRYCMPDRHVTLTARYRYNPSNPNEPSNPNQEDVLNKPEGDINADGMVDVSDAVLLLNYYLVGNPTPEIITLCDMNADGTVDVTDAVLVLNKYMEEE